MLPRFVFRILLLCLPGLLFAHSASAARILVFGDSLSAAYGLREEDGWVDLLAGQLPSHEFVNVSISGETTGNGLARLPQALAQHQPDILVIELGANDGLRGFPLADVRKNLQAMIDLGKRAGCRILLLGVQIPPNYGTRYARQFADMYPQLAQENDIAVVPFFLEAIAADSVHFQADTIHPTAAAQPIILATVRPALEPLLQP